MRAARSGGLGVTRGGAYEQALRTRTKASIRWSSTPKRNSTRPWKPGGEIELRELFARHPAARIKLKLCLVGEQKDQIAIAVRPDAPNLAA